MKFSVYFNQAITAFQAMLKKPYPSGLALILLAACLVLSITACDNTPSPSTSGPGGTSTTTGKTTSSTTGPTGSTPPSSIDNLTLNNNTVYVNGSPLSSTANIAAKTEVNTELNGSANIIFAPTKNKAAACTLNPLYGQTYQDVPQGMITRLTTRPGSDCLFQQTEGYTSVLWDGSGKLESIKDSGDCIIKPIDPAVRIIVVPRKETRVAVYRGNIDIRVTGEEKDRRINEKLEVKISRTATGSRQISIYEAAFTAAEDGVFSNQAKKLGVTLAAPAALPPYTHPGLFPDSRNTKSPWNNNKIRMAAEYALDKAAISTGLTAAVHPAPQYQFLPPGETGSLPASSIREYNVSQAKALLAEAGYPNGFKIVLYCSNTRQEEAKAIASNLSKVGIDASLSPVAESELNYMGSKTPGNLVLTSLNVASDRLSSLAAYFLTSSGFSAQTARPSQMDDMITKAQNQANLQMKTAQILQISQILADNATYIPLWSYFGE